MERNFTKKRKAQTKKAETSIAATQLHVGSRLFLLTFLWIALIPLSYAQTVTHVINGSGTNNLTRYWIAPFGATSVVIEAWGGGGGGGRSTVATSVGGGGAGGGYVRNSTFSTTPGTQYSIQIGRGGPGSHNTDRNGGTSWFNNTSSILAVGGAGGGNATSNGARGAAGAAATSGNQGGNLASFYGGAGAQATNTNASGAGGSSAGTGDNGNAANNNTAGTAPTGGWAGAAGVTANNTAGNPPANNTFGGGGSGGRRTGGGSEINGGNGAPGRMAITWSCNQSLPYTTGFNLPNTFTGADVALRNVCWDTTAGGTNRITLVGSGSDPDAFPQEGTRMVRFDSYNAPANTQQRLVSPVINGSGISAIDVEFYWLADNSGYQTRNDGVQIQYSIDGGTTWVSTGSFISRVDLSIPDGTSQWQLKTVPLPEAAGNNANLRVGFLFTSQLGHNCYMDAVAIRAAPSCSGTPNPGNTIASISSICSAQMVAFSLQNSVRANGISYQWQSAPDAGGTPGTFSNISGATSQTLTQSVSATTWYRCRVTCGGNTGTSTPVQVSLLSPTISSTTGAAICGPQTATLSASVSAGAVARWYTASTGGNYVGQGNTFVTPVISANTTYFVQAEVDRTPYSAQFGTGTSSNTLTGYPAPFSKYYSGNKHQMQIRASELTAQGLAAGDYITSVSFIVTGVGPSFNGNLSDFRMDIRQSTVASMGTTFQSGFNNSTIVYGPANLAVPTSGFPATVTIPLNSPVKWDGTSGFIIQTAFGEAGMGTADMGVNMQFTTTSFTSVTFRVSDEIGTPAYIALTTGASSSNRPNIILGVQPICASVRQGVNVNYSAPPALTLNTNLLTICQGSSATANVTSPLGNFTSYSWSPALGATPTGTPVGASVSVSPTATTTYVLTASNASCTNRTNLTVTVNPKPPVPSVTNTDSVCQSASVTVGLTSTPGSPTNTITGRLSVGPTYSRAEDSNGSSTFTATTVGTAVYYQTYTFIPTVTGSYTFSGCGTPSTYDVFGSIYQTSFNPAVPSTNFLQADDDGGSATCSPWGATMTQNLTAGVTYVLVTSSYWNAEVGDFTWTITGPGSVSQPANLRWYLNPTGGAILSTASPFNPVGVAGTGLTNTSTPGTYTFYAANFNGTCESDRVAVNFFIRPQSIAPAMHQSTVSNVCSGSPVTLRQTGGQLGQGATWRWYTDPACTPASLVGSSTAADAAFVVNPTTPATYYVRAEGGSTPCSPVNTPVTAVGVAIAINPPGYWMGNNTNWNDASNWCSGIPTGASNIIIPDYGPTGNYPTIPAAYTASINNLTMGNNARLVISNTARLNILGSITNNGSVINRGEIALTGTGAQDFPGTGSGSVLYMNQLTVDKSAGATTISQPVTIAGALIPTRGNITINQPITIRSTNDTTARVGIVGAGVTFTYGTGGRFIIERYIPARRAWRLLTSPITSTSSQPINGAWQEGTTLWPMGPATGASNPNPGYGTHISGGSLTNGYDQNVNGNASIRYFNNGWVNLPTSTSLHSLKVTDHRAYMVFVRGSRALNMAQGPFATPDNTTLRSRGEINVANSTPVSVTSTGLTLVGNPFASAINFRQLANNNGFLNDAARNRFYLWDPTLAGTRNVGAFVTVAYNTATGNYDRTIFSNGVNYTTAGGNQGIDDQGTIQSGLGFFMNFGPSNSTLNFAENVKIAGSTPAVFRPGPQVRTTLKTVLANGDTYVNDGVLVTFQPAFSNGVDQNDVEKVNNFTENLSLLQGGQHLAIERRNPARAGDTLHLRLRNLTINNFQLEFAPDSMANPTLTAFLGDRHLNTERPISLTDTTRYDFTVAANPASIWAEDRFYVVFKPSFGAPVPVRFVDIQAFQRQEHIAVEWKVAQEVNIDAYEVERSVDGRTFTLVHTTAATAPQQQVKMYAWLDQNVQPGNTYYYRVRSIGRAGDRDYTRVVRVMIGGTGTGFTVYPNPVRGSQIGLQLSNIQTGRFVARLYNASGQLMLDQVITHPGGNANYTVAAPNYLAPGTYQLHLADPAENKTAATIQVLVQ